jgi:L-asparaginase II
LIARDEVYVDVTRGGYVESVHRVAACAVDAQGTVLDRAGDIESPVFLRSAAKPFIAATAIAAGVRERFNLEPREIGMEESALQCGTHPPYDETAAEGLREEGIEPTALHNNCSGKHAGILALCLAIGADPTTYLSVENPAQQRILAFCARLSGDDAATWPVAIDGCGIPVYATGLRKAAISFARLATLSGINSADARALGIVRDAMLAYPEYVAGTGQFDTELMIAGAGNVVSKAGAEGVHAAAAISQGYGYASKVIDGTSRARGPSSIAALQRLGVLDERQAGALARFARPPVYNRAGIKVGEIVSRDRV